MVLPRCATTTSPPLNQPFSCRVYVVALLILIGTALSGWNWFLRNNEQACVVDGCVKDAGKGGMEEQQEVINPFPEPQFFKERDEGDNEGDDNEIETESTITNETNVVDDDDDDNDNDDDPRTSFIPLSPTSIAYEVYNGKGNVTRRTDFAADWDYPPDFALRNISTSSGMHVITTFFHGQYHNRRFRELLAVLISNLENPYITALHVLWQGADPREFIPESVARRLLKTGAGAKLVLRQVSVQPTYRVFFTYMNKNLQRGSIAVVTNADIYFDGSIGCIIPPGPQKIKVNPATKGRQVFALSRRHSPLCGKKMEHQNIYDLCRTYVLSHDAFVVAPPVATSVVVHTDHTQNAGYGAENIVIYEFKKANYQVANPCWVVKGLHLHCSYERHYVHVQINRNPPRPGSAEPTKKRKCLTNQLMVW